MRTRICFLTLFTLGVALIGNSVWADSLPVLNPSLETSGSTIPDWTVNGGTISQTLFAELLPDTTYTFSVDVGRPMNEPAENYSIELFAGSSLLASMGSSTQYITPGTFAHESFSYWALDPTTTQDLTIALTGFGPQVDFANASVSDSDPAPVPTPESSSLLLMGLGFGILALLSKFGYSRRSMTQEKTFVHCCSGF
jgi:hypothetical protein